MLIYIKLSLCHLSRPVYDYLCLQRSLDLRRWRSSGWSVECSQM